MFCTYASPRTPRGLLLFTGARMATLLITEDATVAEIDEALGHARRLPHDERGPAWFAFVDRLLEMRADKSIL